MRRSSSLGVAGEKKGKIKMLNNQKHGGLSALFNQVSQHAVNEEHANKVVRIPISQIKSNPKNFYGLRDIDGLARTIAFTKFVDPLIVVRNTGEDSTDLPYLLIAGHRRKAAWQKLLDTGEAEDRTLPCIIRTFHPYAITLPDGSKREISADRMAEAFLMFSNMGQRQFRSVDERLREVQELEPLARDLYAGIPKGNGQTRGNFRTFFAKNVLEIGETTLQRLLSLQNLGECARKAIDDGLISITLGAGLATLSEEEQDAYVESVEAGERKSTNAEFEEYKKAQKEQEDTGDEDVSAPVDTNDELQNTDKPVKINDSTSEEFDEPADESNTEEYDVSKLRDISDTPPEPEVPVASVPKQVKESEIVLHVDEVPKTNFEPQAEANEWLYKQKIRNNEQLMAYAREKIRYFDSIDDELQAAQWNMRISALQVDFVMLKQKRKD